jgi:hypothetical protein
MAAIGGIIERCGSVVLLGCQLSERYSLANTTLISITGECSSIKVALGQVKAMATSPDLMRLESDSELREGLNTTLNCCSLTLQVVFDEMERLSGYGMNSMQESSWKAALSATAKLRFIINRRLERLLNQLRGQSQALQLLLQAYTAYVYRWFSSSWGLPANIVV